MVIITAHILGNNYICVSLHHHPCMTFYYYTHKRAIILTIKSRSARTRVLNYIEQRSGRMTSRTAG